MNRLYARHWPLWSAIVPSQASAATAVTSMQRAYSSQVTGEDKDEFNRTAKQQIKAVVDRDRDPLAGEAIIAYLRPLASDPTSKGSRKVTRSR